MTWNGTCPSCGNYKFVLTINATDKIYVNCDKCGVLIGEMSGSDIVHPANREPH